MRREIVMTKIRKEIIFLILILVWVGLSVFAEIQGARHHALGYLIISQIYLAALFNA